MIAVICAMHEERDALLKLMKDIKVKQGRKLFYHGEVLDNEYYEGYLEDRQIVVNRCGVGEIYASMTTTYLINEYHPELIINLGCAGSLNGSIHVNDVVIATKAALWRMDVPEESWYRSFTNNKLSYPCDEKVVKIVKELDHKKIKTGPIVSADEFIYDMSQVETIKKYFAEALCGEMEGAAVAAVCYAHGVPCSIIRSISDETLVSGDYNKFDFRLEEVCNTAAYLCKEIIMRY